jgi:hypothetical protein
VLFVTQFYETGFTDRRTYTPASDKVRKLSLSYDSLRFLWLPAAVRCRNAMKLAHTATRAQRNGWSVLIFEMEIREHDESYAWFLSILCHHHEIKSVAVIIVKTVEEYYPFESVGYNSLHSPKTRTFFWDVTAWSLVQICSLLACLATLLSWRQKQCVSPNVSKHLTLNGVKLQKMSFFMITSRGEVGILNLIFTLYFFMCLAYFPVRLTLIKQLFGYVSDMLI